MDYNNILFDVDKTVASLPSSQIQLDTTELQKKMIDLWATCKATPSLTREKRALMIECLSLAKKQATPSLEKIIKKLQKLVEGIKEESAYFQIPKCFSSLPLETHSPLAYFNEIKKELETIAHLLKIPFLTPNPSSSPSKINQIQESLRELEESDPEQYQTFYSFIQAVIQNSLETKRMNTEKKNKKFPLYERDVTGLEGKIEELYSMNKTELNSLHEERIADLHDVLSLCNKKQRKIAIIGGGPAGLIRGLLASYLGFEVKIIEKRNVSYHETEGRPNFLHLGKDAFHDLYPLIYFGVFDRLVLEETIIKSEYGGFVVSICDLERAAAEVLKSLCPHALIPSVDTLQIKPNACEQTRLFYKEESFSADLVMLCDGAKSLIGKQLGLTHTIFYKKMHAPVGFFSPEENSFLQAKHQADGLSALTFESEKLLSTSQSLANRLKIPLNGCLFRKKKIDYVGVALTAEEENHMKTLSKEEKDKLVSNKLIENHCKIDVALSLRFPTHAVRAGRLIEHRLIPIQIKKAETPVFKMGKTLFLVRGDAQGTTHPASGYGAKTALSSLSAEFEFLPLFENAGANPILIEMFTRQAESFLSISQTKGVEVVNQYLQGYEKPIFFIERASRPNVTPSLSHLNLSRISYYFYLQKQRALSIEEEEKLKNLKEGLIEWLIGDLSESDSQEEMEKFRKERIFPEELFQKTFASHSSFVTKEVLQAINPFHSRNFNMGKVFHSIAMQFILHNPRRNFSIFFGLLGSIEKILSRSSEKSE